MVKVILKETIDTLGIIGSEVSVADGYARNYLLPQKKAVLATEQNRKILAQEKAKMELQIAKEKAVAEEMAARLKDVSCKIEAKVSDEDNLYGSVTTLDIKNALDAAGVSLERRMLLLSEPIKKLGVYKVPVRIYKGVEPKITVEVVAEEK